MQGCLFSSQGAEAMLGLGGCRRKGELSSHCSASGDVCTNQDLIVMLPVSTAWLCSGRSHSEAVTPEVQGAMSGLWEAPESLSLSFLIYGMTAALPLPKSDLTQWFSGLQHHHRGTYQKFYSFLFF